VTALRLASPAWGACPFLHREQELWTWQHVDMPEKLCSPNDILRILLLEVVTTQEENENRGRIQLGTSRLKQLVKEMAS
jgi:hypothetical protein